MTCNKLFSSILFILITLSTSAKVPVYYNVGTSGIMSSGETAPFWLHSNRNGMYSASPYSSVTFIEIGKDLQQEKKLFKYGFKANGQLRFDDHGTKFYLQEMYVKLRLGAFDLNIGSREEHLGNQQPVLSSGGFLFSNNARPIPKIMIGIEEFTAIPFTHGYAEIKGGISHGWLNGEAYVKNAFLHHKYAYLRLGGKLPVNIQYGFEHAAQWGGTHPTLGKQAIGFDDFMRVFFGKEGSSSSNPNEIYNALGNHLISQSIRLDFKFAGYVLSGYWQNLNEDGPIKFIWDSMNRPDGLFGISFQNNNFPYLSGILYEYLNTTDQSGPFHDKDGIVYGGKDNYFGNNIYQSGWSYFANSIGTPFITPPYKKEDGKYADYSNRTKVHHIGIQGDIFGYKYRILNSFSKNYGTYNNPFNKVMKCNSLLVEVNKTFPKLLGIEIGCALAADFGTLPVVDGGVIKNGGNTFGALITIRKKDILFNLPW